MILDYGHNLLSCYRTYKSRLVLITVKPTDLQIINACTSPCDLASDVVQPKLHMASLRCLQDPDAANLRGKATRVVGRAYESSLVVRLDFQIGWSTVVANRRYKLDSCAFTNTTLFVIGYTNTQSI